MIWVRTCPDCGKHAAWFAGPAPGPSGTEAYRLLESDDNRHTATYVWGGVSPGNVLIEERELVAA